MRASLCIGLGLALFLTASVGIHGQTEAALRTSPDCVVAMSREFDASPELLGRLLREPLRLGSLWEAYGFSPRYTTRDLGSGIFWLNDPTGVAGTASLVLSQPRACAYLAHGSITHRLVPAFKGGALVSLSVDQRPGGPGSVLRLEFRVRMESRLLGLVMRPFTPLISRLVLRRLGSNLDDLSLILRDLSRG